MGFSCELVVCFSNLILGCIGLYSKSIIELGIFHLFWLAHHLFEFFAEALVLSIFVFVFSHVLLVSFFEIRDQLVVEIIVIIASFFWVPVFAFCFVFNRSWCIHDSAPNLADSCHCSSRGESNASCCSKAKSFEYTFDSLLFASSIRHRAPCYKACTSTLDDITNT